MAADTLASFPYVTVRLGCTLCSRHGAYRLARLAAKYGAEIRLIDLLEHLAGDCRYWRPRHPGIQGCGAYFPDLAGAPRPPDEPLTTRRLRKALSRTHGRSYGRSYSP
jgi:hypothetical protein